MEYVCFYKAFSILTVIVYFTENVDAEKWKSLKSLSFYSVVKSIDV